MSYASDVSAVTGWRGQMWRSGVASGAAGFVVMLATESAGVLGRMPNSGGRSMGNKQKNYRKCEMRHSQDRGIERYGVRLTKKDLDAIAKIVLSPNRNNKVFQHQQDDGSSHWLAMYKDTVYRLVFDERTKTVRTMLDMRPIDHELWRNTHDNEGRPTLGDYARISRLKLK
jgi:hypothetical protein